MIKPRRLKKGDTVAIIRPASRLKPVYFNEAKKMLRSLGFCVADYEGRFRADKFFSASDEDRAEELQWAFSEPGIRAVFAARGGYGSQRTLSYISKAMRAKWRPKMLMGYSDVTYLHQWIQNQMGWVSFHGPLLGAISAQMVKKTIDDVLALPRKPEIQKWSEISNIGSKKKARGRLVGGNLSLFQVAGPAALPKKPLILAIEETNENFYRIDRSLGALQDAGYADFIQGIVVGTLNGCGKDDGKVFGLKRIYETLKKLTDGPIWLNARFGHGLQSKQQRILPLGSEVQLSGNQFKILESAVS
ncbi:MAG: LD-carboxypeptidase [Bacteriovoracaceae bacterium]|nr:LD-carboxypeptidase [Bacteriovoracaceae bacterium]